eukprot:3627232-Ditylum_brightwellii.AAC.1
MQQLFAGMSKLANTPALIRKAVAGRPLDPAPFVHLYNVASDLVRDTKVCTQLGSLVQIFAKPSSLYIAPDATPGTLPAKHSKTGATENKESKNQRKKKQAQKEGWLKKTDRCKFRPHWSPIQHLYPAHFCGLCMLLHDGEGIMQLRTCSLDLLVSS